MHYTSVPNILKVLNPLFLDDLRARLEEAGDNGRMLLNLRKRMSKIRVFDPACGSGNFLVIAYKEMRAIEATINKRRDEADRPSEIPLTNFRGIELRDFPVEIARLALIIAEFQCNVLYRGKQLALNEFLPLSKENWITRGNALRLDWLSVCPPTGTGVKLVSDDLLETPVDQAQIDFENEGGENYICSNPPYKGARKQGPNEKLDPCLSGCLTKPSAFAIVLGMDTTFPTSLPEFQRIFPDDGACASYLEAIRWPDGFACQKCGVVGEPYRFATRSSVVLRCRACKKNTSLTAGTVMQSSHMPLSTWFWGAYLMTTQTPGQSAVQFQRQLGIATYETAFTMLHKLRAGMVRPDRDTIGTPHAVEVDECCIGGRTRGEGRGIHHQTTVVGAVEVRTRAEDGSARRRRTYAGRLRLRVVSDPDISGRDSDTLTAFVKDNVTSGSIIRTDGWRGYGGLDEIGYMHNPLTLGGDPDKAEKHLPMIYLVFSNLKTWINGTHHGRIEPYHLQAYLNEFVFRFNRRFYPMNSFNSVLGIAARTVPPTYAQLYSGGWTHAA